MSSYHLTHPYVGSWGRGGLRAKYWLPCQCIHDSLQFDMQHDHVLIKLSYDLLTPTPESGVGAVDCRQIICHHVVAFVIPFNLICNIKLF